MNYLDNEKSLLRGTIKYGSVQNSTLAQLQEAKHKSFAAFQKEKMKWADKTGHSDAFYIERPLEYRKMYDKMRDDATAWEKEYDKVHKKKK